MTDEASQDSGKGQSEGQVVQINVEEATWHINLDQTNILFPDLVHVKTGPDWVIMECLQALPVPPSPKQAAQFKLVARIGFPWPHFGRLLKLLMRLYVQQRDKAVEALCAQAPPLERLLEEARQDASPSKPADS